MYKIPDPLWPFPSEWNFIVKSILVVELKIYCGISKDQELVVLLPYYFSSLNELCSWTPRISGSIPIANHSKLLTFKIQPLSSFYVYCFWPAFYAQAIYEDHNYMPLECQLPQVYKDATQAS